MISMTELRMLKKNINFFCDPGCVNLNIKETDKNNSNQPHFCTKYKQTLFHLNFHPHIIKLNDCILWQFEEIKQQAKK